MGLFDDVSQRVSRAWNSLSVAGAVATASKAAIGKYAPKYYGVERKILNGDFVGAAIEAVRTRFPNFNNPNAAELLLGTLRNPLLGGITFYEAQRIHAEVQATQYAKKNLFFVEILDFFPTQGGAQKDRPNPFNLFATGVSFGPNTLTGDAKQFGSGVSDGVNGSERVEMRITTYDDAYGTVKRWFSARADAVARPDGTFGVPSDYLIQIRILHAALNDEVMQNFGGFEHKFIMRPASMECELSRSEDNLEEIQMSFVQFDTFMFQDS